MQLGNDARSPDSGGRAVGGEPQTVCAKAGNMHNGQGMTSCQTCWLPPGDRKAQTVTTI